MNGSNYLSFATPERHSQWIQRPPFHWAALKNFLDDHAFKDLLGAQRIDWLTIVPLNDAVGEGMQIPRCKLTRNGRAQFLQSAQRIHKGP